MFHCFINNTFVDVDVDCPKMAAVKRARSAPPRLGRMVDAPVAEDDLQKVGYAVATLYLNKIKPEGVLVQRHMKELFRVSWTSEFTQRACEAHGDLHVKLHPAKAGTKFTVFIKDCPDWGFVDPKARDVEFQMGQVQEFVAGGWDEVTHCVTTNTQLARLMQSSIPRLIKHPLGEVCQLVHFLVEDTHEVARRRERVKGSSRKTVYLVPSWRLDPPSAGEEGEAASEGCWLELRQNLSAMLADDKKGEGISLSHVPQHYESKFGKALNVQRYGFSKLKSLLRDPSLSGVCGVRDEGTHSLLCLP